MTEAYQSVQVVLIFKSYANKTPHTKLGPCILPSSSQVSLTILPSLLPGMSSFELIHEKEQDMLAQAWDPSTKRLKQEDHQELKANLGYIVSLRKVWAIG